MKNFSPCNDLQYIWASSLGHVQHSQQTFSNCINIFYRWQLWIFSQLKSWLSTTNELHWTSWTSLVQQYQSFHAAIAWQNWHTVDGNMSRGQWPTYFSIPHFIQRSKYFIVIPQYPTILVKKGRFFIKYCNIISTNYALNWPGIYNTSLKFG